MAAASAALPVNTDMSFSGWWQGLVAGLLQALVLGALQRFGFVAFNGPARFLSALLNLAAVDEFLRILVVPAGRRAVALALVLLTITHRSSPSHRRCPGSRRRCSRCPRRHPPPCCSPQAPRRKCPLPRRQG